MNVFLTMVCKLAIYRFYDYFALFFSFMKRTYHSDFILQYQLGILPNEILNQIPSSTLHNWKKRDVQKLFGLEYVHDFDDRLALVRQILTVKELLQAAKALYRIYATYHAIFQTVKNRRKILFNSREMIIETIEKTKDVLGLNRALKAFGISYQQFYAWKRKVNCGLSPLVLCRKLNPKQITEPELKSINDYLDAPEYQNWSLVSVYYKMLRDKSAFLSLTSFYKYAHLLMPNRPIRKKIRKTKGLRADAPKKILHMDVTIFKPLDNTKVYLYFLVDNFSRYIINWKASLKYSADITFENISEAYTRENFGDIPPYIDLITDDGSENKGKVNEFVNAENSNIRKLIAQLDIIFSNSMVESVNKRMKYDYLFTTELLNYEQTVKYLSWAIEQYNCKPHSALFGLTPFEVYNGKIPDKRMFAVDITAAATQRKEYNLNQNCNNCVGVVR
ncbi:MAG: DDE-type integrase/transposase/recombinase [Bacteroidales bacterium]|nr:DDE-type integrase/transposase/recombinase [Bacteroidales bacterium]